MEEKDLVPRLVSEFGYPERGARVVAEDLVKCSPQVKEAFASWWNDGILGELQVEGHTVQQLMEEHGLTPIAAFLTLDWLSRDREEALAALAQGHDWVG